MNRFMLVLLVLLLPVLAQGQVLCTSTSLACTFSATATTTTANTTWQFNALAILINNTGAEILYVSINRAAVATNDIDVVIVPAGGKLSLSYTPKQKLDEFSVITAANTTTYEITVKP